MTPESIITSRVRQTILLHPFAELRGEGADKGLLLEKLQTIGALPTTLFLHVDGHVEWSIFSGHAWGRASVSTDEAGANPYNIHRLRLRIIMNTPDQQNITTESTDASINDNDVKWVGRSPIFSGPHTSFDAYADDPFWGSWSNSTTVY